MRKCPRKRPNTKNENIIKAKIYRNEYRFINKDKIILIISPFEEAI
jgi:hypothetical protein